MNLSTYLRNKFSNSVRDYYIGSKCEVCDVVDGLELHHNTPFSIQLEETLNRFGYSEKRTSQYTDKELGDILIYMTGIQVIGGFSTMCQNCHMKHHHNNNEFDPIKSGFQRWVEKEEQLKITKEHVNIRETLIPYLNSILNKKLYQNEQAKLTNKILKTLTVSARNINYRTKRLNHSTLENILRVQLKLNYAVSKSKIEGKGEMRGKRYIIITKITGHENSEDNLD